jgi:hypothetical protein
VTHRDSAGRHRGPLGDGALRDPCGSEDPNLVPAGRLPREELGSKPSETRPNFRNPQAVAGAFFARRDFCLHRTQVEGRTRAFSK